MLENNDEVTMKMDIYKKFKYFFFELALCIPFFNEALYMVEIIFAENSNLGG